MKIQVVSDLHLEFSDVNVQNAGDTDVLILSGDIIVAEYLHDHPTQTGAYDHGALADLSRAQERVQRFRDFFKRCSFQFPHVVYIAGNHEFYHGKFHAGLNYLKDECSRYPNIHFLERDTWEIEDVAFIGGTLWTDCNKGDPLTQHALSDMMNDYRVIKNDKADYARLRPAHTIERHVQTKAYFETAMDNYRHQGLEKRVVIVGHHAPTLASIDGRHKGDHLMNGGYASDLSEFILDYPEIRLWTHGHTHVPFDYMVGTTRVVCNPRGYVSPGYSEETGWDPMKVFTI